MELRSIDFVEIQVKDWPVAVNWYQDKLALRVTVHQEDHQFCLLQLADGTCKLALYGVPTVEVGTRNRCIPAIQVNDLSEAVAEMRDKDVAIDTDISGGEEGYRWATIADCEGNLLHLFEWYKPE